MKNILLLLLIVVPAAGWAQVDRTTAPKPGPAPLIKVADPASFTLPNGLKVFVVQNTKLPRVSATLTLDYDGIMEGDKAGLTSLSGQLLMRGTSKMNKATLDEEIDYLGGSINATALSISGFSLKNNFPKLFSLMADIALRPSFPADELEKIRKQELSGIAQGNEDANTIAGNVSNRLLYGIAHPYGDVETEETVKKVTLADVKTFYQTYWKPNAAYLILVGDITTDEAKKLTEANFGSWQKGVLAKPSFATPVAPAKTYIAIVDRPSSVQSVINIVAPIQLQPGTPDAIPSSVMNNLLGNGSSGRLYKNLREKYGFTYGAYSGIKSDRLIGNFTASASVRNEKTDSAIGQFLHEFNRIRSEAVENTDITQTKNEMSGSFARSLENPGTIAGFALNVARYNLPQDYYQNYLKTLAAVDAGTVRSMANKYIVPSNVYIVIVGNAKEIAPGLEKYGEVKYFDVYGNPKAAPSTKKADASVTGESLLRKSIEAQGGQAAIAAIKDVTTEGTASVMGQSLSFSQKYVFPAAFVQTISMSGMSIMKQMVNNGKYVISMQGAEMPVEDKDKEDIQETASLFLESYMLKKGGYSYTVNGIEQVDGKDAYAVGIKSPGGRSFTYYYDLASGLRVKESKTETAEGNTVVITVTNKEFRTVNGVKIPVKLLIDQGALKINIDITDVKVNQGLKAEDIK